MLWLPALVITPLPSATFSVAPAPHCASFSAHDEIIKKAHLAPDDMYETTGTTNLTNPFGGSVWVDVSGKMSSDSNKAFVITLGGIPQEACIELLTQDWGAGASSGLIALGNSSTMGSKFYNSCSSDNDGRCASQGVMPVNNAINICSSATDNIISWKFY